LKEAWEKIEKDAMIAAKRIKGKNEGANNLHTSAEHYPAISCQL
jgi:hypothetical protein